MNGISYPRLTGRTPCRYLAALGAAALLIAPQASWGEVLATAGRVETRVQELLNGSPGSVNADAEEMPADQSAFPLTASALLNTTDLEGRRVGIGQGFSVLEDPAPLDGGNPQEFALETACYSNAAEVSYLVESVSSETRTVVFSRDELELGPFGTSKVVTSRAFLSGVVILWSSRPITSGGELRADISFEIISDTQTQALFVAGLAVADGTVEAIGPMVFGRVDLDELAELGVNGASIAILQSLDDNGELVVLAIPPQEHPYTYAANVDEPILLTATVAAAVRNAPDGTGVAAVMGRPFEELSDFIEQALPGTDGDLIERALNKTISRHGSGLLSPPTPPINLTTMTAPRMCGTIDRLAPVMLFLLTFSVCVRRNRA